MTEAGDGSFSPHDGRRAARAQQGAGLVEAGGIAAAALFHEQGGRLVGQLGGLFGRRGQGTKHYQRRYGSQVGAHLAYRRPTAGSAASGCRRVSSGEQIRYPHREARNGRVGEDVGGLEDLGVERMRVDRHPAAAGIDQPDAPGAGRKPFLDAVLDVMKGIMGREDLDGHIR